jgi:hypothetical protein
MDRRTKWIAGGALVLVVVGGGTGVAIATGADNDEPLTGSTLEQARAAALEYTGRGTVIESEAGDDGAAYGVEIRLDGRVVEVSLDANFNVVGDEADDGPNDEDGADDDG